MKITINDLSFHFPLYERQRTMDTVKKFIAICRKLESKQCHNVEALIRTEIDKDIELYPTGNLRCIIQEIPDRDERGYFVSLLVNRGEGKKVEETPFSYKGLHSYACAAARKGAVVSLETDDSFKGNLLKGMIGEEQVQIKNISCEEHIQHYRNVLGIRIYEANNVKHKKDRSNPYGKGKVASPMDLSDEEAQDLLDCAIWINGRLYARKGKKNYAFQKTQDGVYHAYIADDLKDNILTKLYSKKWD